MHLLYGYNTIVIIVASKVPLWSCIRYRAPEITATGMLGIIPEQGSWAAKY